MAKTATIYGINGPVISLRGNTGFQMSEMVYIGKERLVGEVIRLTKDTTTVQCFEETTGLAPGETVEASGDAISVLLGPGILHNIFDGIQRPLGEIAERSGRFISRGVSVGALDAKKKWKTHVTVKAGDAVQGGTVIAEVPETGSITHRSMVPPAYAGTIVSAVPDGEYTIEDVIAVLEQRDGTRVELKLAQKWPIRIPRPTERRYPAAKPLVTGQRILDTLFPLAKGGTAAIPGGFGTGKTMTQHSIAKWSDADIIIYNSSIDEEITDIGQLLEKSPLLADFKAVREGNVWCSGKNMFQQPAGICDMIVEMNKVITGSPDGEMEYLHRVETA